jgi:decaprenyl-phosphate phosphoribosyltransferase
MIGQFWKTMRPIHWIKNLFVFAPMFFSGHAMEVDRLLKVCIMFIGFSAMASAVYCLNDIMDRERDQGNPVKCKRPIASGALPVKNGIFLGLGLAMFSVVLIACSIGRLPVLVLLLYAFINLLYSIWLKHIVIVDVFCISIMFVLRVLGGGATAHVSVSSWLVMTTFLLALFLALAKRRQELVLFENGAGNHRPVLDQYTPQLADEMMSLITPAILITYILYALSPEIMARFNSPMLYVTTAFVIFGIMRYQYLVHRVNLGYDPTELIIHDLPLMTAIVAWVFSFYFIIYIL